MEKLTTALKQHLQDRKPVRIPAGGDLLWVWFTDLSNARTFHSAGPNPISFTDIEAYARLHRIQMESRHVDAIRSMDSAFIDHFFSSTPAPRSAPAVSARPMSGTLFDAMFK